GLKESGTNAALVLTGNVDPHNDKAKQYYDYLVKLAEDFGVSDRVIFAPQQEEFNGRLLNYNEAVNLYKLTDFLLFTSSNEGFGLPVLEAGFLRKPVVCSDIPAFLELLDEDTALILDTNKDPIILAKSVKEYLSNNELAERNARNLHQKVIEHYTWNKVFFGKIVPFLTKKKAQIGNYSIRKQLSVSLVPTIAGITAMFILAAFGIHGGFDVGLARLVTEITGFLGVITLIGVVFTKFVYPRLKESRKEYVKEATPESERKRTKKLYTILKIIGGSYALGAFGYFAFRSSTALAPLATVAIGVVEKYFILFMGGFNAIGNIISQRINTKSFKKLNWGQVGAAFALGLFLGFLFDKVYTLWATLFPYNATFFGKASRALMDPFLGGWLCVSIMSSYYELFERYQQSGWRAMLKSQTWKEVKRKTSLENWKIPNMITIIWGFFALVQYFNLNTGSAAQMVGIIAAVDFPFFVVLNIFTTPKVTKDRIFEKLRGPRGGFISFPFFRRGKEEKGIIFKSKFNKDTRKEIREAFEGNWQGSYRDVKSLKVRYAGKGRKDIRFIFTLNNGLTFSRTLKRFSREAPITPSTLDKLFSSGRQYAVWRRRTIMGAAATAVLGIIGVRIGVAQRKKNIQEKIHIFLSRHALKEDFETFSKTMQRAIDQAHAKGKRVYFIQESNESSMPPKDAIHKKARSFDEWLREIKRYPGAVEQYLGRNRAKEQGLLDEIRRTGKVPEFKGLFSQYRKVVFNFFAQNRTKIHRIIPSDFNLPAYTAWVEVDKLRDEAKTHFYKGQFDAMLTAMECSWWKRVEATEHQDEDITRQIRSILAADEDAVIVSLFGRNHRGIARKLGVKPDHYDMTSIKEGRDLIALQYEDGASKSETERKLREELPRDFLYVMLDGLLRAGGRDAKFSMDKADEIRNRVTAEHVKEISEEMGKIEAVNLSDLDRIIALAIVLHKKEIITREELDLLTGPFKKNRNRLYNLIAASIGTVQLLSSSLASPEEGSNVENTNTPNPAESGKQPSVTQNGGKGFGDEKRPHR
ncbi:MAG: glycosyltransferase, partial [Candidatus Omnitrophica bacterium]|nr:glycosyltransferase [Candidatus Omnitrophota bacterium]